MSALMSSDKRASERVIPMVTDEEMVVIDSGGQHLLAKMMDLSDTGTLVYMLLESASDPEVGTECSLSLYHHGKVFDIPSVVARQSGRLIAFRFNERAGSSTDLQAKLIRMEVEWKRLKSLV
jgi:hypothetical protein